MSAVFDPFEVLGVRANATSDEIRAAYREQVARYHPDKHRGNPLEDLAAARLVEINRAYEVLSDDVKRAQYEAVRRPSHGAAATERTGPIASMPNPVMKLVRSIGLLVTLLVFIRFGLALGGQLLAIVRALVLGVLFIFRANPILALVIVIAIAVGVGYARRAGKGREE